MEVGVTAETGGAVACPVCTLYLREGISLQRHLDTHPKEQVIEALIKASGSSSSSSLQQLPQSQVSQVPQVTQTIHSTPPPPPLPPPLPPPPPPSSTQQTQQVNGQGTSAASAHIPAQSPYPIGPVFECPPINAMMPPQFASFSYQQFVNNGTMMIPQYAMAPPQANQMMQMLYNPYSMYQQQQVPTVQMISPVSTMPPTRIRPVVAVSNGDTNTRNVIITTSTNEPKQILPEMMDESDLERIMPNIDSSTSPNQSTETTTDVRHDNVESNARQMEHRDQQTQSTSPRRIDSGEIIKNATVPMVCQSSTTADEGKSESILPNMAEQDTEEPTIQCRDEQHFQQQQQQQQQQSSRQHHRYSPIYEDETNEQNNTNVNKRLSHDSMGEDKVNISGIRLEKSDSTNETIQSESSSMAILSSPSSSLSSSTPTSPAITTTTTATIEATAPATIAATESTQRSEVEHLEQILISMIETGYVQNNEVSTKTTDEHNNKSVPSSKAIAIQSEDVSYQENNKDIDNYYENINNSKTCIDDDSKVDETIVIEDSDIDYLYRYKHSSSAPASPSVSKTNRQHCAYPTRSGYGSIDNINSYPVGFEATTLHADVDDDEDDEDEDDEDDEEDDDEDDDDKNIIDNFDEEDMEIEELGSPHTPFTKHDDDLDNGRSHTSLSHISGISGLRVRSDLSKPSSPVSMHSFSNIDADSHDDNSNDFDNNREKNSLNCSQIDQSARSNYEILEEVIDTERLSDSTSGNYHQSVITEHISSFPTIHSQQQSIVHDNYSISSNNKVITDNPLDISGLSHTGPTTSAESKSFQSTTTKSISHIPTTELLNINEDAHSGPMNVFEFDGLQILVPSTFISDSSQKAISATSQQSMASSEGGAGIDEEVKSVNMRADETMPPRGELSEQESNGCTEHSAWQVKQSNSLIKKFVIIFFYIYNNSFFFFLLYMCIHIFFILFALFCAAICWTRVIAHVNVLRSDGTRKLGGI